MISLCSLMGNFTLLLIFSFLQNLQSHKRFTQKTIANIHSQKGYKAFKAWGVHYLRIFQVTNSKCNAQMVFCIKGWKLVVFQMWQSFAQSLAYLLWFFTKVQCIKILIISPSLHVHMKYCATQNERILKYYHVGIFGPFGDQQILCTFTSPNLVSQNLKVIFHPKYCV